MLNPSYLDSTGTSLSVLYGDGSIETIDISPEDEQSQIPETPIQDGAEIVKVGLLR